MWRSSAVLLAVSMLILQAAASPIETGEAPGSDVTSSALDNSWFRRHLLQSRPTSGTGGTCCVPGLKPPCACPNGAALNAPDGRNCGTCNVNCHSTQTCATVTLATGPARRCDCKPVAKKQPADCDRLLTNGCEVSDLLTDERNCGACGTTCTAATQECIDGVCACKDGGATDLRSDPANCGGCGRRCTSGQSCVAGACRCIDGVALNTQVSKTNRTVSNCGTCGNTCRANQDCTTVAGVRQCACRDGFADKDGNMANGCEASTASADSCGIEGEKCSGGMQCISEKCTCPNTTPAVTAWNDRNCGQCGRACTGGQKCDAAGVCRCSDPKDGESNGVADLTTEANCGTCGNTCERGTECLRNATTKAFTCTCPALSATTSPYAAPPNWTGAANCGECGNNCTKFSNMVCATTAGVTDCACRAGFASCDKTEGCEVNTNTNNANCGKCGNTCNTATTGMVCVTGGCQCKGLVDDEGNAVTAVNTDAFCGSCTTACDWGQACDGEVCRCEDGSSLLTTTSNCGICGNRCPDGQECVDGQCGCSGGGVEELLTVGTDERCSACDDKCGENKECKEWGQGTGYFFCDCKAGWGDCDGDLFGNCETAINTKAACGACPAEGGACGADQTCDTFDDGTSACSCGTGENTEATPLGTDDNCASCGASCSFGTTCTLPEGGSDTETQSENQNPWLGASCMCPAIDGELPPFDVPYLPTDLSKDPNCGACGVTCGANSECTRTPENDSTAINAPFTYACLCKPGFADCDEDSFNGCEVPLASLNGAISQQGGQNVTAECGACGVVCNVPDETTKVSDGSVCSIVASPALGEAPFQCKCPISGRNETGTVTDCGVCGNKCAPGAFCDAGVCKCVNPTNGNFEVVTDFNSSPTNCGRCGNVCADGQSCVDSVCKCPGGASCTCSAIGGECAPPPPPPPPPPYVATLPVDFSRNPNCGRPGVTCGDNSECRSDPENYNYGYGNSYACLCMPGGTRTGTFTDCGVCGNKCAPGSFCGGGACICINTTNGDFEVVTDFNSSPTNCGRCGNVCANGQTCVDSVCKCPGGAVKLTTDAACGNCDTACTGGQVCYDGNCIYR